MSTCIIESFSTLKAPRLERHMLHSLTDIIVLAICAISSGSDGWEAIEDFGKEKEDWLRQYIPLKNGIPSHDCIAYTLRKVSPSGFRECFMKWVNAVKKVQTEKSLPSMEKQPEIPEIEKTTESLYTWSVHGLAVTVWFWGKRQQMKNKMKLQPFPNC
jgi:predicted transposase YbfD/YdcC